MQFRSLSQEDPLEEEMANHSSILAWEIPWTEDMKIQGLQETRVATREESGVLGFPSRGLQPARKYLRVKALAYVNRLEGVCQSALCDTCFYYCDSFVVTHSL